jgi:predicted anti-sigma-YlaC factor YlaD
MDHQTIKDKLLLFGDPELSKPENDLIKHHLDSCEECRQTLNRWQSLRGIFSQKSSVQAPSTSFTAGVMNRIHALQEKPRRESLLEGLRWVMPALGYAFAILLVIGAIAKRAPSENMDRYLLVDISPADYWVVSDQTPDVQELLGITMEES